MCDYTRILRYFEFINSKYGYKISVRDFVGFVSKDPQVALALMPYYIHCSPYCIYIKKTNANMEKKCQDSGYRFMQKCNSEPGCFIATCYCGYNDFVIPVEYHGRAVAAICFGGFEYDQEKTMRRMRRVSEQGGLDFDKLQALYQQSVFHEKPDCTTLELVGGIIADFFQMYFTSLVNDGTVSPNAPYMNDPSRLYFLSMALRYIQDNYSEKIRLEDIARYCGCSTSYISHSFKKNINKNVSRYINEIRVNAAKTMLAETEDSVNIIADRCGFSDPNYFSTVFKDVVNTSPSTYRQNLKVNQQFIP